ncbi:glycosyltransferase family 4 protein [Lysobacter claricitrinus]|uniref:glycosyltransferase family 4 protein n=1 Tax=Lysobacter claricitrinus TaxID=3367728 RepID=UPI0037DB76E5
MADIAVWFPAVRTGTGTDVFTERLVTALRARGVRAEVTWLSLSAEYAPWTVRRPPRPPWATVAHVNTWLHPRFVPADMPMVATLHHSVHDPALRPYKGTARDLYHRFWMATIERRVLLRADVVVAVSRFVAECARSVLLDVPMRVIHNGVDTRRFAPVHAREARDVFRLLYVGTWMARKGVDLLAPVMRQLGDGYELRHTGGGRVIDHLDEPANMHNVGRLAGDDVITAMREADALLFPSRSEGLPLVVVEAMACGLPVVARATSSLPEVVEDGVTGMLVSEESVEAIAATIRQLAADEDARRLMGQRARQRAEDLFGIERMVDAYIECYQAAISART